MVSQLVRLQALAFWRAPYLGGRIALAMAKGGGVVYAVGSALIIGFVWPDLLGVVAPLLDPVALVETWGLPALAAAAAGRVVFQDVPTRGAMAFLTLPVSRQQIAAGVLVRSVPSPFGIVPLAFAVPFAARTVRAASGVEAAWAFVVAVLALVVASHALLIVWKTRLGARPVPTIATVGSVLAAVAALEWVTGGLLAHVRTGGLGALIALCALAGVSLGLAYRALVAGLYLDAVGQRKRQRRVSGGFEEGGVRAFVDLDRRLVARATFSRSTLTNAAVVSIVMTVGSLVLAERFPLEVATDLVLIFSTGTVAGSLGQYAVPFASRWFDRLLTLPDGLETFVRAKYAGIAAGTVGLGAVQALVVLVMAPAEAWLIGVSVLFSLGVLAPAALLGSTLGPKPLDVSERLLFVNTQSFGAQALVASTAVVAGIALTTAGPTRGALVAMALGCAGVALSPVWLGWITRRISRHRHRLAARFRTAL
ncbi:MAG: DUF5687 family protein [Bacteroidota bacterium]